MKLLCFARFLPFFLPFFYLFRTSSASSQENAWKSEKSSVPLRKGRKKVDFFYKKKVKTKMEKMKKNKKRVENCKQKTHRKKGRKM